MNLLKEFKQYIEDKQLFGPTDKLLVAVSGGLDSMVLLDLLVQTGYKIEVAHANFKLRESESDQDETLVKTICHKYHIPFHSKEFETRNFIESSGLGLQEAARILRYQWFIEIIALNKLDFILTAHHANDMAETILFNLVRGTGINGLSGIKCKNDDKRRPLLFATKNNLLQYATKHQIEFRIDSSNEKDLYTRNYIRHHILPHLVKINPSFVEHSLHFSELMLAGSHYYQKGIDTVIRNIIKSRDGNATINLEKLLDEPYPTQLLFEIIHKYGFNFLQCSQIIKGYKNNKTGGLFFSDHFQANLNRKELLIEHLNNQSIHIEISAFPFNVILPDFELEFSIIDMVKDQIFNEDCLYLNADKIQFPLQLRQIIHGDRFQPLGMKNSKKISDYLIDKKVDRFKKEKTLVLTQNEKEICAVIPFQISEVFKVTPDNQSVLLIQIKKAD